MSSATQLLASFVLFLCQECLVLPYLPLAARNDLLTLESISLQATVVWEFSLRLCMYGAMCGRTCGPLAWTPLDNGSSH